MLQTSDDRVAVLRRSAWTGEFGGFWDRPGGHPEPSVVVGGVDTSRGGQLTPLEQADVEAGILKEVCVLLL